MRRTFTRPLAAAALLAALPSGASAHEGHGLDVGLAGVAHWLSSPHHLVGVVAALAVLGAVGTVVVLRRRAGTRQDAVLSSD